MNRDENAKIEQRVNNCTNPYENRCGKERREVPDAGKKERRELLDVSKNREKNYPMRVKRQKNCSMRVKNRREFPDAGTKKEEKFLRQLILC